LGPKEIELLIEQDKNRPKSAKFDGKFIALQRYRFHPDVWEVESKLTDIPPFKTAN